MEHAIDQRKNHARWLAWRQGHLGASEAHIVCEGSLDELRRLWARKCGVIDIENIGPLGDIGLALEPIVRRLYTEQTGRSVMFHEATEHHDPEHTFLSCSPDGLTFRGDETGEPGLWEAKTVSGPLYHSLKLNGLPRRHYWQLVAGMDVLGLSWSAIAVLSRDTGDFFTFDMVQDAHLADIYRLRAVQFWRCVTEKIDPADSEFFAQERTEERAYLPPVNGRLRRLCDEGSTRAFAALAAARQAKAEIESLYAQARLEVERVMSSDGSDVAECAGLRVYWTPQAGRKMLDPIRVQAKAKAAGIDLSDCYKETAPSRPFRIFDAEVRGDE